MLMWLLPGNGPPGRGCSRPGEVGCEGVGLRLERRGPGAQAAAILKLEVVELDADHPGAVIDRNGDQLEQSSRWASLSCSMGTTRLGQGLRSLVAS
jgi:hypothetical protein